MIARNCANAADWRMQIVPVSIIYPPAKRYIVPGYTGYTGANYGDPRNVMFTVKYTPRF